MQNNSNRIIERFLACGVWRVVLYSPRKFGSASHIGSQEITSKQYKTYIQSSRWSMISQAKDLILYFWCPTIVENNKEFLQKEKGKKRLFCV